MFPGVCGGKENSVAQKGGTVRRHRFAGDGNQNRNRRFIRHPVDFISLSCVFGEEIEGDNLFFNRRIVPAGDIGSDGPALRKRDRQSDFCIRQGVALPPVADVDAALKGDVDACSVGVMDPVGACQTGLSPSGGMQEEESRQTFPDPDVADRIRKFRPVRSPQNNAGAAVVPRRIQNPEGYSACGLQTQRHSAEIVAALIGPAAFPVVVRFVPESGGDAGGEVNQTHSLLFQFEIALDRGKRTRLLPVIPADGICQKIPQIFRGNAVAFPVGNGIQLGEDHPSFAEGRLDKRRTEIRPRNRRTLDHHRIHRERNQTVGNDKTVIGIHPRVKMPVVQTRKHRMRRAHHVDKRRAVRQKNVIAGKHGFQILLFQNQKRSPPLEEKAFQGGIPVHVKLLGLCKFRRNDQDGAVSGLRGTGDRSGFQLVILEDLLQCPDILFRSRVQNENPFRGWNFFRKKAGGLKMDVVVIASDQLLSVPDRQTQLIVPRGKRRGKFQTHRSRHAAVRRKGFQRFPPQRDDLFFPVEKMPFQLNGGIGTGAVIDHRRFPLPWTVKEEMMREQLLLIQKGGIHLLIPEQGRVIGRKPWRKSRKSGIQTEIFKNPMSVPQLRP